MGARSAIGGLFACLAFAWAGEPAWADRVSCYVSRAGEYGEIIATVSGGSRDEAPLAWAPGLMLEYSGLLPEGLTRPVSVQILVSRVADRTLGSGPSIDELSVRATLQSGMVMAWTWPDRREGEARLARSLEQTGEGLLIELLGPDRTILASSSFLMRPDAALLEALRDAGDQAGRLERAPGGGCRARSGGVS